MALLNEFAQFDFDEMRQQPARENRRPPGTPPSDDDDDSGSGGGLFGDMEDEMRDPNPFPFLMSNEVCIQLMFQVSSLTIMSRLRSRREIILNADLIFKVSIGMRCQSRDCSIENIG